MIVLSRSGRPFTNSAPLYPPLRNVFSSIEKGQMFGSIQPNAYVQGYLCMTLLYLAKNSMLDPLNGTRPAGQFVMNLPYVDNGLDLINADNAKYFYTDKWQKQRGAQNFKPW